MNALTASIQHVEPSELLFLVPLVPLSAAALNGLFGERLVATRGARATNAIALISSFGTLALIASVLYSLFGLAVDQRALYAHLWSFARVGSLSASVDLLADPLGASLGAVVLALASVAHLDLVARDASPTWHARVSLLAGGLLLAVLGDGFVPLLLGFSLATIASALLATPARALSILAAGHLADAAVLAGAVVLFWGLGGGWGISVGNEPSFTRRNPVPVRVQTQDADLDDSTLGPGVLPVAFLGTPSAAPVASQKTLGPRVDAGAKGKISLAGLAGAKIFLRGSNVPAATAPVLGLESFAGRMDIEVELPGMPRTLLRAAEVPAHGEIVLVPMGPTLSMREIYDQLALVDLTHKRFARDLLDPAAPNHRKLFGVSVVSVAALLFAMAAVVRGALLPFLAGAIDVDGEPRTRAILIALSPLPAVFLVVRLAPIFTLAASVSTALIVVGALSALVAAFIAASRTDRLGAIRAAVVAQGALALAGAGAGAYGAAMLHVVVVGLSAMALILAHDLPGASGKHSPRSRASLLATIALAGAPIPVIGVALSREPLLQRIFAVVVPAHLGQVAWGLSLASVALVAHALVRTHLESFPGPDEASESEEVGAELRNALFALIVLAALLSYALVVSQTNVGIGPERSLAESWLAVDVGRIVGGDRLRKLAEVGRGVELGIAALTVAASVGGWRLARNRRPLFSSAVEVFVRLPSFLTTAFVEGLGAVARFVDFAVDLPLRIVGLLASRRSR